MMCSELYYANHAVLTQLYLTWWIGLIVAKRLFKLRFVLFGVNGQASPCFEMFEARGVEFGGFFDGEGCPLRMRFQVL